MAVIQARFLQKELGDSTSFFTSLFHPFIQLLLKTQGLAESDAPEMGSHGTVSPVGKTMVFCSLRRASQSQADVHGSYCTDEGTEAHRRPVPSPGPHQGQSQGTWAAATGPQLPVFLQSSRNRGLLSSSHYDSVTMETTIHESSK